MKRFSIVIALSLLALSGCVSAQTQQNLAAQQAQCRAGNQDACTAASYQGQAAQQEQATNAATAAVVIQGVGAAVLGAAILSEHGNGYGYSPYRRGWR